MAKDFTEAELEAYLEEALLPDAMADVEASLRSNSDLARKLARIIGRRDAGVHTLGEIWRRHRVSCPTREQLGSMLLGAVTPEESAYIAFHVEQVGCRICSANLDDMKRQQQETGETAAHRRSKYFQSSAGYLRPDE